MCPLKIKVINTKHLYLCALNQTKYKASMAIIKPIPSSENLDYIHEIHIVSDTILKS